MMRITPILIASFLVAGSALAAPELSRSTVLKVVQRGVPDVVACAPGLNDEVTARFTITPMGAVRGVKIDGKHAKTPVGKCMKRRIAALKFPSADKATPVVFPYRFWASAAAQPAARAGAQRLARKDVDALLDVLEGDLKKCGEGTARAKFSIAPGGKPRDVQVDDVDAQTGACVQKRISRVRFPAAEKPTPVERAFLLDDVAASDEG